MTHLSLAPWDRRAPLASRRAKPGSGRVGVALAQLKSRGSVAAGGRLRRPGGEARAAAARQEGKDGLWEGNR